MYYCTACGAHSTEPDHFEFCAERTIVPVQVVEFHDMLDLDQWYVRGHVPPAVAIAACEEHLRYEFDDGDDEVDVTGLFGPCSHTYGFWGFPGLASDSYERVWYEARKRRGATPVTKVWFARAYEDEEQRRAVAYAARSIALRRWPRALSAVVLNPWPWRHRQNVVVELTFRSCRLRFYPWNADRSYATPRDLNSSRPAQLDRMSEDGVYASL